MAAPISLSRVDIAPIEYMGKVITESLKQARDPESGELLYAQHADLFKTWLANFVDVFNENMQTLETFLNP